jgi:flagellar L-ring protein precursor FlgH
MSKLKALAHNIFVLGAATMVLAGCNKSFHDLGAPPIITPVGYDTPLEHVLIPPEPEVVSYPDRVSMEDNGIWNQKDSIYFKDTRAYEVGDILTVEIFINESARFSNSSDRTTEIGGTVGSDLEGNIGGITLPNVGVAGNLDTELELSRGQAVSRTEQIRMQIAATVTQASPNGNLRIVGSQEVRVNAEMRILTVHGIVRTKDIRPDNSIPYEKIAEARISYGGHNSRRVPKPPKKWNLFGKKPTLAAY